MWDAAFTSSPEALQGDPDDIADARALFIFPPLERVDEVVFIAAPHGGSAIADGWLARVVQRFVQVPADTLGFLGRLVESNPEGVDKSLHLSYRQGGPDSFGTLSPEQPVSRAGRDLAVMDGVRVHSIIGIRDQDRPERGDGVVTLDSASWPVGTVDYVPGAHDLQNEAATITVLKKILLERLARGGEMP